MSEYDYKCMMCEAEFDGREVNAAFWPPDICPKCGAPESDIVTIEYAEECLRINARED